MAFLGMIFFLSDTHLNHNEYCCSCRSSIERNGREFWFLFLRVNIVFLAVFFQEVENGGYLKPTVRVHRREKHS